ncbi:MAG: glycosyltransferase family 61 protein, partial [Planctomycetes bacterium]|nr:glycosyltransferase family 61 protein [Planctomycetota bacterium]
DRHRKLINIEEIEEIARDRGFHICYPEDLPFRKQLQIVRGATHVMAPEGSAIFLAFFARRGTKLLCLDHPFVEKSAFVEALFRELQIETVLVTGNCVREDSLFSRFSDYVIDPSDVRRVLAEWKSAPARSRSE